MKTAIMIVITLFLAAGPLYGDTTEQPPPTPAQEQPEVLTRGPVHEAFAEPVNLQVQAGLVAPKPPPANIAEITPAQRPAGEQFVLVPGTGPGIRTATIISGSAHAGGPLRRTCLGCRDTGARRPEAGSG